MVYRLFDTFHVLHITSYYLPAPHVSLFSSLLFFYISPMLNTAMSYQHPCLL